KSSLQKLIEKYYADLKDLAHQHVLYEMGTRPAFHALLAAAGREHGWTLIAKLGGTGVPARDSRSTGVPARDFPGGTVNPGAPGLAVSNARSAAAPRHSRIRPDGTFKDEINLVR